MSEPIEATAAPPAADARNTRPGFIPPEMLRPLVQEITSQLNELEATERVLARYSTGTQARKTSSAKMPTTGAKAAAPARPRGRRRIATAKSAGGSRSSPSLNDQVLALATGKTQQEITAACKGARPNHDGAAIARHKRAGRVEERDGKLYATQPTGTEQHVAAI